MIWLLWPISGILGFIFWDLNDAQRMKEEDAYMRRYVPIRKPIKKSEVILSIILGSFLGPITLISLIDTLPGAVKYLKQHRFFYYCGLSLPVLSLLGLWFI